MPPKRKAAAGRESPSARRLKIAAADDEAAETTSIRVHGFDKEWLAIGCRVI
jgi:hypothetical protein